MKIIVIGTSLSGKTTIISVLRNSTDLPLSEIDEELTRLNNGQYPTDSKYKHEVLTPKIINGILNRKNIIFFTNTNYFSVEDLNRAKESGFKIVELELGLEDLIKRNEQRVKSEGYDDMSRWFAGMLEYQKKIKDAGLVDKTIEASKSKREVVRELLEFIKR